VPALILTRILDPAELLERAVEGVLSPRPLGEDGWPTLHSWMILRQGGLRDDLHHLAAARGVAGWFDAPIALFTELEDRWGPEESRLAMSEPERHALLARLLEQYGAELLPRGSTDAWVPMVDRFIGELLGEDVTPAVFAERARQAADDSFATRRASALAAVYDAWHETLHRHKRRDGRDARVALARAIREDPQSFAARLGGRREVRIIGLADLRGGWRALLETLAASPALDRIEIITSAALDLPGAQLDTRPVTRERPEQLRLLEAPDAAREMEHVAVAVRALVDAGVPPARIAVIAREARPAVDAMADRLQRLGVPVTARRRTALAHTAPARALLAMLGVLREDWGRHAVAELAEQPLLRTGLDAGIINALGYTRALATQADWRAGLADLAERAERRERGEDEGEDRRTPLPASARIRATLAAWDAVAPRLVALERERTLEAWCAWAAQTLEDGEWGIAAQLAQPCGDDHIHHLELRAHERIRALLFAWQEAARDFGGTDVTLDASRFVDRLSLILAQDLITMPRTDAGVLVSEALAAGWRAFDHVFVVGLSLGSFPKRPAEALLLHADEREALRGAGLPLDPTDAWRERERELFRVICAAPRASLTLSWPALDSEGRETARSAFVDFVAGDAESEQIGPERVLTPGYPIARDAQALAQGREAAAREADRRARDARVEAEGAAASLTPWNGEITDPELLAWLAERYGESYQWSATQLETLAKCPWHWFASRLLRLEDRRDADDLLEPSVSGHLRHDALDRFFARARDERGAPVVIGKADEDYVNAGIARALHEAWSAAESAGMWLGPPAIRTTQQDELLAGLRRYLAWEMKFNDDYTNARTNASKVIRSGAIKGEHAFENVTLEGDGVTFKLRGLVDRIDQGLDDRIPDAGRYLAAIDYKSSRGSTPGGGNSRAWDDGIVLQVPLYAKALQRDFPEQRVVRMEYRTLSAKPERVHALSLAPVEKGALADGAGAEAAQRQLDAALDAAGRRVRAARAGALPAAPAPSAGCSPFCPARDICRIPGGPREGLR
jgi:hypothetical protein